MIINKKQQSLFGKKTNRLWSALCYKELKKACILCAIKENCNDKYAYVRCRQIRKLSIILPSNFQEYSKVCRKNKNRLERLPDHQLYKIILKYKNYIRIQNTSE